VNNAEEPVSKIFPLTSRVCFSQVIGVGATGPHKTRSRPITLPIVSSRRRRKWRRRSATAHVTEVATSSTRWGASWERLNTNWREVANSWRRYVRTRPNYVSGTVYEFELSISQYLTET